MTAQASIWTPLVYTMTAGILSYLKSQLRNTLKNIVDMTSYYSIGPTWGNKRGLIQALTQDYNGRDCDITISPWSNALSFPQAMVVSLSVGYFSYLLSRSNRILAEKISAK
jgi:hypothetical protein